MIGETHLRDDQEINIDDYICIPHNRKVRHLKSKRNYGGVCVLVKNTVDKIKLRAVSVIEKMKTIESKCRLNARFVRHSFAAAGSWSRLTWNTDGVY